MSPEWNLFAVRGGIGEGESGTPPLYGRLLFRRTSLSSLSLSALISTHEPLSIGKVTFIWISLSEAEPQRGTREDWSEVLVKGGKMIIRVLLLPPSLSNGGVVRRMGLYSESFFAFNHPPRCSLLLGGGDKEGVLSPWGRIWLMTREADHARRPLLGDTVR